MFEFLLYPCYALCMRTVSHRLVIAIKLSYSQGVAMFASDSYKYPMIKLVYLKMRCITIHAVHFVSGSVRKLDLCLS